MTDGGPPEPIRDPVPLDTFLAETRDMFGAAPTGPAEPGTPEIPAWEIEVGAGDLWQAALPARPKFVLEPLADIRPDLTGFWIIKGLVPARGLMVVYGLPGSFKSFVGIDASLHIAAGFEWAGRRVNRTGVVYVASEGRTGFRKRVYAAKRHHHIPDDAPFSLVTVKPNLGMAEGDKNTLIRDIRQQAADRGIRPGLIVIDTLARSIEGSDESSAKDMGVFVGNADQIGQELDALVLVIHHAGKSQDRGMRGSSALHGAADAEWEILKDETGARINVVKMKDGQDGLSLMFRTQVFDVGSDEDGDPVSTLVTEVTSTPEHSNVPAAGPRGRLVGQKAEFIKAVRMAIDELGERVPANDHVPNNVKGVSRQNLALYSDKLGFTDGKAPEVRRAVRNRLIRTLAGDGFLGQWGDWIWVAR